MLKFENDAIHVQTGFGQLWSTEFVEDPREKRRNMNTIIAGKCAAWFRFM